jgi:hypothetical protein
MKPLRTALITLGVLVVVGLGGYLWQVSQPNSVGSLNGNANSAVRNTNVLVNSNGSVREFSELPIRDANSFFPPAADSASPTSFSDNVTLNVPSGTTICAHESGGKIFAGDDVSCASGQMTYVSIIYSWGPGEQQDTHFDESPSLEFALGDSLTEYRDALGLLPGDAQRIVGKVGASEVLGIVWGQKISIVVRQGKKTVSMSTSAYGNSFVQDIFATAARTILIPASG